MEELQGLLEKQNFELSQARERLVTLSASVTELEEDLGTARRDLLKSEELSSKHQRDLREVGEGPGLLSATASHRAQGWATAGEGKSQRLVRFSVRRESRGLGQSQKLTRGAQITSLSGLLQPDVSRGVQM